MTPRRAGPDVGGGRSNAHPPASRAVPRREARLEAAASAQHGCCFWCGRAFSALVPPTTDHLVPRVKGGPSWPENEVAACRRCNAARGHVSPVDWTAECRRRAWPVDEHVLRTCLERLDAAITARGGARRARPYVRGQLRRLGSPDAA